jgi:hypothetical protein
MGVLLNELLTPATQRSHRERPLSFPWHTPQGRKPHHIDQILFLITAVRKAMNESAGAGDMVSPDKAPREIDYERE